MTSLEWKKVIWEETPEKTQISQGYYFDEGEFVKLKGDFNEILIRKDKIIAIKQSSKGDIGDRCR